MTLLVTGAGTIGLLTATLAAARGQAVVVTDIRAPGAALPAGINFAPCDVTDASALDGLVARHGISAVVHTAAMLSTGIRRDPVRGVEVNVMGALQVLDCARRHGLRRVVCASSTTVAYSAFGARGSDPVGEDEPLRLVSQRPGSLYAASKIAGEHLALLYRGLHGVDAVTLRYAAVLGGLLDAPTSVPGQLLARMAAGARAGTPVVLDDPFLLWSGREEFVDARDCARANLCALDAAGPAQGVYNVATGAWHTLAEFVAAARRILPGLEVHWTEVSTGFAGFPHRRPAPSDVTAARAEIGFSAAFTLEETMAHWTA